MRHIMVTTKQLREVLNITPQVEKMLEKYPARDGMIHLYLRHTTAALTTAFIDEDVDLSLLGAFEIMLPHKTLTDWHSGISELEHTHHVGHLPAHVVATMLGPHLMIPIEKNKLKLGTFQSVVLVELNGPKEREIVVYYKEAPRFGK